MKNIKPPLPITILLVGLALFLGGVMLSSCTGVSEKPQVKLTATNAAGEVFIRISEEVRISEFETKPALWVKEKDPSGDVYIQLLQPKFADGTYGPPEFSRMMK